MAHNFNYSEDTGYVDIRGRDVRVLVCNKTGSMAVPIDELKDMGFRLYRKSQYSRLLIDDNQFQNEFYLYMLECAQTYMLQKETVFKENDILENINKCKAALTGNQNNQTPPKTPNNFVKNHVVEKSPDPITVTANLREFSATMKQSLHNESKFTGFVQSRSPTSKFAKNFQSETRQNNGDGFDSKVEKNERSERYFARDNQSGNYRPRNERNSIDQRRNGSDARNSFDRNNAFEQRSPRTDGIFAKNNFGKSSGAEPRVNFNNYEQDGQQKRGSESHNEPLKKLETIELNKPEHNVLISFIEKSNCAWVQDVDNANVLLEIDGKVKEESAKKLKVAKPLWNKIYLALMPEDNMWYRCKIIKFKPFTVFFVDYGNIAEVTEVLEASESLSKIPCQAVRITFHETQYTPEVYDNITVRIKNRFDNGTHAVEVKTKEEGFSSLQPEPPKAPTTPTFFTKPQPLCLLEHGQRVMLFSHTNGKLALRTKECYDKLKQLEKALYEEEAKAEPVKKVEKGQLVLCKKKKLQRGVVTDVRKSGVEIELLDYCDSIRVDLATLAHISEDLAKQQLTYILSPQIKEYNEAAEEVLRDLCQKKTKGTVVLSSEGDFDIKLVDKLLSNQLKTQHSHRTMLKDFKAYSPPLGLGNYMLNVYEDKYNIYFSSEVALTEYLECVMKAEMEDNPYEPIMGEVCLGLYQDSWSRCVILDVRNDNYEVRFIDFGNLEFLKPDQMRKLTDDAKRAPILAFCCQLTGLPSISSLEDRLKQNLLDGNNYDIKIKKSNGVTYDIEIPAVVEALRKYI